MAQSEAVARDVAAINRIKAVPTILRVLSETTGLRYVTIARVTSNSWTACAVLDRVDFGLGAGDQLDVTTTLCSEVRDCLAPIVIDKASEDARYSGHRTPKMYGFESYIAVPIVLRSGEIFGTICALDPKPAQVSDPKILRSLQLFAELIASQLELDSTLAAQKRALAHQDLLINELNHRVKNTLATVQSIAFQSLRSAETMDHASQRLESRLMALARVHDVLTRESWDSAELRTIVHQAISPFESVGLQRFRLSGPPIRLPPRQALPLSMAIHELLTNALKYGALSLASGQVSIAWDVDAGGTELAFRWDENGGPPVEPPSARGFGTRLIERGLAQELGGSVAIEFDPSGVTCAIAFPLNGQPI